MSDTTDLEDQLYGLDFDVAKSMRYHLTRRVFWDNCNRANKILGVLSGSAVLAGIIGKLEILTVLSGAIVALFSTLDLVFDFSNRSRAADDLYRRWSLLAQEIALEHNATHARLSQLRRQRLGIEMDEGPHLDLLERRCAYDEAKSRDARIDEAWQLTWVERQFAQFIFWRSARR